jgi:hypothetical protein
MRAAANKSRKPEMCSNNSTAATSKLIPSIELLKALWKETLQLANKTLEGEYYPPDGLSMDVRDRTRPIKGFLEVF